MTVFNTPVATVINDQLLLTTVLVTGVYNAATNAANSIIITPNTFIGANNSQTCIADVVSINFISDASGWLTLEYVSGNTSNQANQVIAAFGPNINGQFPGSPNLLGANSANGEIQLVAGPKSANDSFSFVIVLQKNNQNGAWANQYAAYQKPGH